MYVFSSSSSEMERRLVTDRLSWMSVALAPLIPVSHLYGLVMRARSALYAVGLLPSRSLPVRVVSIGNLTLGGTGKTPVVIALATALAARGRRVGIVSRGYGRRHPATLVEVSDGQSMRSTASESGDEPVLIAERCPGLPVAVAADRYQAGRHLIDRFQIDTLLLDDGFQHQRLRRDIDVLILDATAPFGNGYVFPRGRLRECPSAMQRGTMVLLTRTRLALGVESLKARIRDIAPGMPIGAVDFTPSQLIHLESGRTEHPTALRGERVVAVSGIGNPESFEAMLSAGGAVVAAHRVFSDHHEYSVEEVQQLAGHADELGATRIVTTEKDAVKLKAFSEKTRMWAVRIDVEWVEGFEEWTRVVLNN